jgi:hypothetical protein
MKKIPTAILFFVLVGSCNNSKTHDFKVTDYSSKSDVFEVIDYSTWGDIPELTSIKIYKSGKAYMFNYDQRFDIDYYNTFSLSKMEMDTISKLVMNILKIKFDTLYSFGCDRCICYNLIINSQNAKFHTTFLGQLFIEKNMKPLDSLASNMKLLIKKYSIESDSVFKFNSRPLLCEPKHSAKKYIGF